MTVGELRRLNNDSDLDTIVIYSKFYIRLLEESFFYEVDEHWNRFEVYSFNVLPQTDTLGVKFNVYIKTD